MADLVVGREAYGQSEPIALSAGVDTRASFDAALTDAAYQLGAGDVRVREVDERGNLGRTLAQCTVPLRFPAGVACG
jgi:hypothetical protein